MLTMFNALVTGAVLLILIIAGGRAVSDTQPFDPLALAVAVAMLLALPILLRLANRGPKGKGK
jgi:hypothetical protein